jgi:starch synthase
VNILFVAAENGALAGGKVGGIGDVIGELPPVLVSRGHRVTVMTPSYGFLHLGDGSSKVGACRFRFRGEFHSADIHAVLPAGQSTGVTHLVIHHPALNTLGATGIYRIYTHDRPDRPFFTDGTRFALFSAAVAAALSSGELGPFDVVHLHDWHAALVALLGRYHPDNAAIGKLRWVFSIHNLAFQGVRPLRGSESSLEAWFPQMPYDWATVADPRWPDCFNPMAVGIRLADRVHTVSPSYAREIRQPSRTPQFYGGEGLESDLERIHRNGRLVGILNGCRYERRSGGAHAAFDELLDLIRQEAIGWSGDAQTVPSAQFIAFARCLEAAGRREEPDILLTSVGRAGEQKMLLLLHPGSRGKPGLAEILEGIGRRGRLLLLGSGDERYDRFLTATSAQHDNFIFVNGYSDRCARALYASGDLFLMPSSFEPCGLSQLLAMRDGQPCVVHAVGGLRDTVRHGHNGFSFSGATLEEQVDRFVRATLDAVALKREDPEAWTRIRENALATRFTWEEAADRYLQELYE